MDRAVKFEELRTRRPSAIIKRGVAALVKHAAATSRRVDPIVLAGRNRIAVTTYHAIIRNAQWRFRLTSRCV